MGALVWAGVAALGGAGALARFWFDGALSQRTGGAFPYGTLAVNLTGAFALGALSVLTDSHTLLLLIGGGFLGSYTTFSTWMFETERLGEQGRTAALALNLFIPLACGLAAAALGRVIAQAL
ncbi:MAG: fluoride efflux transporter CrcB [Solirubrobacterales bacterium]|nr:fluoride efflux transporter CrcB [Solirubrobacterales bacterium]